MNNLMIFENRQVEVFELEGRVLFNPRNVGECLDLTPEAVRKAIMGMNEKQVIKLNNSDVANSNIRKLNNAGENFLTESGVYKLIFKSRKAEAEKFQDWVTDEVLPAIREKGEYKKPQIEDIMIAQLQEQKVMKANIEKVEKNLESFKINIPLFNPECEELQARLRKKVVQIMGYNSRAYNDNSLRGKVFSDLQKEIKRQFGVTRYKAIKRKDLKLAFEIIENYRLPIYLENEIIGVNSQVEFDV